MATKDTVLRQLTERLYSEVASMMGDEELRSVVSDGLTVLYGPPLNRPEICIVTFQGGGEDKSVQSSPPTRLLYRDDPYRFGTALRRYMAMAGLLDKLADRTVAHAVVFPQAPSRMAKKWMAKNGPRARWREFSRRWTERLIEAQRPKVLLVFGEHASEVLGIQWRDVERKHRQNHMTFGRGDWKGIPSVYCHHLSQGCPAEEAIRCMTAVRALICASNEMHPQA